MLLDDGLHFSADAFNFFFFIFFREVTYSVMVSQSLRLIAPKKLEARKFVLQRTFHCRLNWFGACGVDTPEQVLELNP